MNWRDVDATAVSTGPKNLNCEYCAQRWRWRRRRRCRRRSRLSTKAEYKAKPTIDRPQQPQLASQTPPSSWLTAKYSRFLRARESIGGQGKGHRRRRWDLLTLSKRSLVETTAKETERTVEQKLCSTQHMCTAHCAKYHKNMLNNILT